MSARVLEIAALVLLFVGLFLIGHAAAGAPTRSAHRIGLRGLKRQRALAQASGFFAQIEPLVRWTAMRVEGFMSTKLSASLDRQINMAGGLLGLLPEELVALMILGGLAGLIAGVATAPLVHMGPVFSLAVAAFGVLAPSLWLSGEASDRAKAIGRRLPNAIDLIALSMGAGLDFPSAVRQAVEKSGTPDEPLIEELALILQSLQLGRTRREALEEFAERAPINPVRELVGAVVQAELRGNPLADVLRIQAEVSRQKRSVMAEEAAAKAGVSLIGPLVLVFVAILILVVGPIVIKLHQSGL